MAQEIKIIGGISLLTLAIIIGGIFFLNKPVQPEVLAAADSSVLMRNIKHAKEAPSAKVTLVEFADFQCPACGAAYPVLKEALKKYEGQITFIYRHFPLVQHKYGMLASKASEAAAEQGKFWEMYDLLYTNQTSWSESDNAEAIFISYAKKLGLDVATFTKDLTSNKYNQTINNDYGDGIDLGVNSTPTFFLNGKKLQLRSFADITTAIDEAL